MADSLNDERGCLWFSPHSMPHRNPKDRHGRDIFPGDRVRVIGIPNLSGMPPAGLKESLAVFRYLVGRYEKVVSIDDHENAQLVFSISHGRSKGWHAVMIEPILLRRPIQPRPSRTFKGRCAKRTPLTRIQEAE